MDNRPIGVFDSGSGGLTVLAELQRTLPKESVIYYADLARVPFGSKSKSEIITINEDIINYLLSRDVKMVIVACNTSSAIALEYDKDRFEIPIIGVITPGAMTAASVTKNRKVGVLATEATVRSHAYKTVLQGMNPGLTVIEQACPRLVPLIEAGERDDAALHAAAKEYMEPLIQAHVDTIVLGCTHYPLIADILEQYAPKVQWINPAVGTVALAREVLERRQDQSDGLAHYEYVMSTIQGGEYVRVDGREFLFRSASVIKK